MAAEDAAARKTDHSAVQIHNKTPTEARKREDASGSDSAMRQAEDSDDGAQKRLPGKPSLLTLKDIFGDSEEDSHLLARGSDLAS
ncbi:hypothetical protein LTR46_007521 [Exophiala xenobiotica]|nr:hypothetical protein LTR46_007521 [Exophiala xenobiotica]